ncbi:MAG: hypothetical protein LQ338_007602 [Usnochroma carphineum]|nr:MAG: hypothetical protein LQ338_007602 [Usnochroma carphineum]
MPIFPSGLSDTDQQCAQILSTAVDGGDLATIRQVLETWPSQPSSGIDSGDYVPELWPFKAVLSGAIEKGNPEIVSDVLDRGLKIELYAVMLALDLQSMEVFQVFIDHGWDINMPLGETTPPCLAYVLENEDLTRWFLAHGASPTAPASLLFRTPIMLAAMFAPLSTVKFLCAHATSLDDVLQSAAGSDAEGRLEVMGFLLDEGSDMNAITWKHHAFSYHSFEGAGLGTALHYAIIGGYKDKTELLLKRGARFDVPNSMGQTALEVARVYGRDYIHSLL